MHFHPLPSLPFHPMFPIRITPQYNAHRLLLPRPSWPGHPSLHAPQPARNPHSPRRPKRLQPLHALLHHANRPALRKERQRA
ncbi:hypothetical protein BDV10DRAFT_170942 [Aspergillus recurvatus]